MTTFTLRGQSGLTQKDRRLTLTGASWLSNSSTMSISHFCSVVPTINFKAMYSFSKIRYLQRRWRIWSQLRFTGCIFSTSSSMMATKPVLIGVSGLPDCRSMDFKGCINNLAVIQVWIDGELSCGIDLYWDISRCLSNNKKGVRIYYNANGQLLSKEHGAGRWDLQRPVQKRNAIQMKVFFNTTICGTVIKWRLRKEPNSRKRGQGRTESSGLTVNDI
jgi:hypothetical protein